MSDKIALDDVASGYNLSKINVNFDKIETELNEKVLYRDPPDGAPNEMSANLDMNGKHIYNLPVPVSNHEAARLKDIQNAISGAKYANLIEFEPTSLIASENVQEAIEEVSVLIDNKGILSLKDYGAKGDGIVDDTVAINNWINAVKTTGKQGYAPAGRYKATSNIVIDLISCSGLGLTIEGAGMQRTIFDLTSISSGIPFLVTDSNGSTNGDAFYITLANFGVHTNINGVGASLGKNDFSDALNASVFDRLYFANASTGVNSCALEVNYVVQSYLNVTTNCGGSSTNGDSLRIRQAQFCAITGSGGNSANSMHITGGYSFGNTILNWDAEEVKKCFVIDVATASSNTFLGGQIVHSVGGIDATAGSNNIFMNPNFGIGTNKVLNSIGITVIGDGKGYGTLVVPNTIVRPVAGDAVQYIDAVPGQQASLVFMRNGVRRWQLRMDNSSESGSNLGSNLVITHFDDAGNNIGDVLYVTRQTGQTTVSKAAIQQVGFYGASVQTTKPTVSGSRGASTALTSLISALSTLGLINDTTTA